MLHGCLFASSPTGWSNFPSVPEIGADGELFGGTNRRRRHDLRGYRWAQMSEMGGTNTTNGGQIELRAALPPFTTFAPLGTYWDGGPGPAVFTSKHNGNPTWVGAWCEIDPVFRAPDVMIACVGRGGTDSGSPTFGRIGYRMLDYDFPFPANSTAGCTVHTRDFVFFGGSQHAGGGDADEFQTDAPRVVAAKALLDPLALAGHAAGGWTYLRGVETDPTTKTSIANEFGPEVGMMVYLHQQGKLAGSRVLGRYQLGTPTPDWVATHFALLVANVTAAGMNPSVVFYIVGGQDSTNLAAIANLQMDLQRLAWLVEAAWPGALFVVRGVVAEDAATFTQLARARVEGSRIIREPLRGKRLWVPHDASGPVELQPTDNTHPTDAGTYDMGFDDYGPIAAAQAA